jgi:uncharacterized protein YqgC (DUF456 family)
MSLKAFHVVFVTLALLLAGFVAWWAVARWHAGDGGGWLAMAIACALSMVALAVYGVWFLKKTKEVSFL